MSETYIKVILKKDSSIASCIELIDELKKNKIIEEAEVFLKLDKKEINPLDLQALYGNRVNIPIM